MDIQLALMCGIDIPCPQLQTIFHQPTIREIALIGETTFFTGAQCLLINKKLINVQGKLGLENLSNFHIFMMIMGQDEDLEKKESVKQVLSLVFPNYSILFTPRTLILKKDEVSIMIDETNFELFQESIRWFLSPSNAGGSDSQVAFNPKGKKAEEIAKKLMRGRERVAAQNSSGDSGGIFSQYLSVLAIGIPANLSDLTNLTMYQFFDLLERYNLYISWDIDIRARMAGASSDKPMDNWMKKIR